MTPSKNDGFVKSPYAVLRFTVKGLNVRKVRLALSRLARLAYETFYKAVGHVYSWAMTCPFGIEIKKLRLFTNPSKLIVKIRSNIIIFFGYPLRLSYRLKPDIIIINCSYYFFNDEYRSQT